jgi:membrane protein DedA with SNARE-associated domain
MAGIGNMRFGRFMIWNVAGAVAWASLIGLLSYYLGAAVVKAVQRDVGIGIAVIGGILLVLLGIHLLRRRMEA